MRNKAAQYFMSGYNCSQCVLMAARDVYGIKADDDMISSLSGVCLGFGTGCICGLLVGAVMVFGLLTDESGTLRARIKLLDIVSQKYGGSVRCPSLKNEQLSGNCEVLVSEISGIIENIIKEGL
ncbi:MAG: C-GCAxxG-C-C family protein [Clostridiales bacterium]|jgi:C_GCAxxG_C_C family probable redox protein|nr:C-GCAxxG-C-C family protein [Clostridiales bacterium]